MVLQALIFPVKTELRFSHFKSLGCYILSQMKLCEQLPSQNLRKTREPDMVQQNLLWKIFKKENIVKRHISNKIFTQMLCGQQVLPSTYRHLHSLTQVMSSLGGIYK